MHLIEKDLKRRDIDYMFQDCSVKRYVWRTLSRFTTERRPITLFLDDNLLVYLT